MNWAGREATAEIPAIEQGFVQREALMQDVRARLTGHRGFAIATLNLDHAVKLRRIPAFRDAYCEHTHITADGNPVVWFEWLAGRRVDLIPGADLVVPLARVAAETGRSIALVGSTDAVLSRAADALALQVPGLVVSKRIAPPEGFDAHSEVADAIVEDLASDEDLGLVFLALGAPKQEIFAVRLSRAVPCLGVVSVGAGLDFLAGEQRRAPYLMRMMALEWLWRLINNPRRLAKRYAQCAALLPGIGAQALRTRWHMRDRSAG